MARARRITVDGITDTMTGWAARSNISVAAISLRLKAGWSEADAVGPATSRGRRRPSGVSLRRHIHVTESDYLLVCALADDLGCTQGEIVTAALSALDEEER